MNRLGRRTNTDFSKHIHESTLFEKDGIKIQVDTFYVKGTCIGFMQFINTPNGLAVFGDYGNWIFCRTFYPDSDDTKLSDGYMLEKLNINSKQVLDNLDVDTIDKELDTFISDRLDEGYTFTDNEMEELKDWIEDLKYYNGDSIDYLYKAFRETPSFINPEAVPYYTLVPTRLQVVFDAFEEICLRLKESEVSNG